MCADPKPLLEVEQIADMAGITGHGTRELAEKNPQF